MSCHAVAGGWKIWEERLEQCTLALEDLARRCGTDGSRALCERFGSGMPTGDAKGDPMWKDNPGGSWKTGGQLLFFFSVDSMRKFAKESLLRDALVKKR